MCDWIWILIRKWKRKKVFFSKIEQKSPTNLMQSARQGQQLGRSIGFNLEELKNTDQFSFVLCERDVMQFWGTFAVAVKLSDPFHCLLKAARHYYNSLHDHWIFPGGSSDPLSPPTTTFTLFFYSFGRRKGVFGSPRTPEESLVV